MTAKAWRAWPNGNGKRLATQQSVNTAVKAICDIMRRSNCAGALQYVPGAHVDPFPSHSGRA